MRKALLLPFLAVLWPCYARTFISADGKTLEADLVTATHTHATLKTAEGKEFVVPLERLSEPDRRFIEAWVVENVAPRIMVKASRDRVKRETEKNSDQKGFGDSAKSTISETRNEAYVLSVEMANRENREVQGLSVKWQAVIRDRYAEKGKDEPRKVEGEIPVPAVEALRSVEVQSEPIDLESSTTVTNTTKVKGEGERFTESDVDRAKEVIDSVSVQVMWKDQAIATYEIK